MFLNRFVIMAYVIVAAGCMADGDRVIDEFKEIKAQKWDWHEDQKFDFEITEGGYYYDLSCGLRITGSYKYSNIWLIYTLEGPETNIKKLFQITLSDNTGKWLGNGRNNLISFEQKFARGLKLKPGKYSLKFNQNMRDQELESVSDIGLKVEKSGKIY